MNAPSLPARYDYCELLGQGGMGHVHRVFDREREAEIGLKILAVPPDSDADAAAYLFKQEYWAMASLRHPNLVAGYDYGSLPDGRPYFTMELVPGHDLSATAMPATEESVRGWLPGVAAALGFLHGRGFVHADLKPENIRLREDGVAKLMDLGLLTRSSRSGGAVRGSVSYLAPEVIRQGAVDGRSDLYALGAVLYHQLSGRPPFESNNTLLLLRAHLSERATPLRERATGISPAMEAAVAKLLAKDPAERFARADALLAALSLESVDAEQTALLGSPVIGRTALQQELRTMCDGTGPAALWLWGDAGAGKTRLLEQARAEAQLAGLTTFSVQGVGRDAPPYQALRTTFRALTATPSSAGERLAPVLARLLPELGGTPAPPLDGPQERLRLQGAVTELVTAHVADGKAVWLVDDADQLDGASLAMLAFIRRAAEAAAHGWIFTAGSPEGALAPDRELTSLDEADVLALAQALLGQVALPTALVDRLLVLSGGVPGTVEALLGHWLYAGALRLEGGHWLAGADTAFALPGGLRPALDARFAALNPAAQHVGHVAAVLGAAGPLAKLSALADSAAHDFFQALAELEQADVLRREDRDYRFVRPAQATALAAAWPAERTAALHSAAAEWMAGRLGGTPEAPGAPLAEVLAVASHHLHGTQPTLAIPWVIAGVRRGMALFALDPIEPLLLRVLALPGLTDADKLSAEVLLANTYRHLGRTDAAVAVYQDARLLDRLEAAADPGRAQEYVSYGILQQLKGDYAAALETLERALAVAAALGDVSATLRARRFAGRVSFYSGDVEGGLRHLNEAISLARASNQPMHLVGALSLYGYLRATSDTQRMDEALACLDEAATLNQDVGDAIQANEILNVRGNLCMSVGRYDDARAAFAELLTTSERLGIVNDAIFARLNLAASLLELGDLTGARRDAHAAAETGRVMGRKFPEAFGLAMEGAARTLQGEIALGLELLGRSLDLAREIKNRVLELSVLLYQIETLTFVGRGEAARDAWILARNLARETGTQEHDGRLERQDHVLALFETLSEREPSKAAAAAMGDRLARWVAAATTPPHPVSRAYALRWQGEWQLLANDLAAAEATLEAAEQAAGTAGLALVAAEVTHLRACAARQTDRPAEAQAWAEGALARARALGHPLLEAECLTLLPGPQTLEGARRLQALVAPLDEDARAAFLAWPLRQAAADAALIGPAGSVDAQARDVIALMAELSVLERLPALLKKALVSLVELAQADRGFLLLFQDLDVTHRVYHGMSPDESDAYSSTLAYQVLYSGQPLFVEDLQGDATLGQQQSIMALGLRSVVGLPILDGDRTIGVILADSQRINTHFGPDQQELAIALGRQIGSAIAQTRRMERSTALIRELELLHRLSLATLGVRELSDFMAAIAAEALALSGTDQAYLLTGAELTCRAAFDREGWPLPLDARDLSQSVCRWVYAQEESLFLADAQSAEHFQQQHSVMALGLRTVYAVPVLNEGRCLGVLYMQTQSIAEENQIVLETLARLGDMVGAFLGVLNLEPIQNQSPRVDQLQ